MNLIPTDWQEEAARQSNDGGSSQGFGYTARALLERRVTSNWFVGTAIDIQQAKNYAPSHFLLYVRYSAAGWQGDMDLPPQPLIPYADGVQTAPLMPLRSAYSGRQSGISGETICA